MDHFATVAEAVAAPRQEPFRVVSLTTPDGHPATVHLALSDASGDSAIFEYVGGKQQIHHGREYQVMTNSPVFDQQPALNAYWDQIGGDTMLPGTSRAADRFVRASFSVSVIPQTAEITRALASILGVARNCSVPLGITTPGAPNIASTLWRTVADEKNRTYDFESTQSPYLLWLDCADLDLSPGAPTRKLALDEAAALVADGEYVSGNAATWLQPAAHFAFLPA